MVCVHCSSIEPNHVGEVLGAVLCHDVQVIERLGVGGTHDALYLNDVVVTLQQT
jgi:hypothetical protein